jgi:hypothetical protein
MLRNKSIFQISTLVCLSSISICNLLTYLRIKMDLREIGWDGMDWIDPVEDRDHWRALMSTVMNLRVP